MTKRLYSLLLIISLFATSAMAVESAKVYPSRRGVMAGMRHCTLVAIQLDKPLNKGEILQIDYTIPLESQRLIEGMEVLVSDSLAVRDLDDYKGRVSYKSLPLNSWQSATISQKDIEKRTTLYIVANLATPDQFNIHDILRFRIHKVSVNGEELSVEQVGDETFRRFFRTYTPLFVPGDGDSKNYRIPAIHKTHKGTLIALADRRKFNQTDIPEDIDIIQRRSFDNGRTWSQPEILIAGTGKGKGFGDAAIVQTNTGKLVMVFIGGPGLWGSRPDAPQPTYMKTSDDDGATWSEAVDITHFLYGKDCADPIRRKWWSAFCASGQGAVTKDGRIMFVAAFRVNDQYKLDNYLIYSDDEGKTWNVSELACKGGDEAKVIVMPDESILMSVRNPSKGDRIFRVSQDKGITWQPTADFSGLHDPACNGAPLFMQQNGMPILLHSLPFGPKKRWDGAVYGYNPYTKSWSDAVIINHGMSAYSDMIDLGDGAIGYFVEEDNEMSLVYIVFTLEDLQAMQREE
ncbi:hypothetical protein IX332_001113 [Porphyromonas levii]|uniref:sialidase family protein n=1 Tax=Porphyromonas levii TaxID=28114 RepID=UPI001B8C21EF|nr:sialidase family protein [Porphyromonas levii]MBR8729789.1 hypothetical protein [Porphyromonas levii]